MERARTRSLLLAEQSRVGAGAHDRGSWHEHPARGLRPAPCVRSGDPGQGPSWENAVGQAVLDDALRARACHWAAPATCPGGAWPRVLASCPAGTGRLASMDPETSIAEHWADRDVYGLIVSALERASKSLDSLTVEDLAPVDHFHARGFPATVDLADRLPVESGHHLLDIGCGVGGPARYLAQRFGCNVSGIDITGRFVEAANKLTALLDMGDRVFIDRGTGSGSSRNPPPGSWSLTSMSYESTTPPARRLSPPAAAPVSPPAHIRWQRPPPRRDPSRAPGRWAGGA